MVCKNQEIDHVVFHDFMDKKYLDYLKEWKPSFMLMSGQVLMCLDGLEEEDAEEFFSNSSRL